MSTEIKPAPPEIDKTDVIRRFVDTGLSAAVDKAIAAIPEDKRVAAIAFADTHGAGIAIATKLGAGWSLMGVVDYRWGGVLEAQAAIRWVN